MHGPRMVHAGAPQTAKPKVTALSMASVYVTEDACQSFHDFMMGKVSLRAVKTLPVWAPVHSQSVSDLPRPALSTASMCHKSLGARGTSGNPRRALQIAEMSKNVHTFNTPAKSQISKVKLFLDARSIISPQEYVVLVSSIFMMGPRYLLGLIPNRQRYGDCGTERSEDFFEFFWSIARLFAIFL
jgi:hypothetical protein